MASYTHGEPIIRFKGVGKAFGENVVLDNLDIELAARSTSVIIGPSGTGKSVFLKLLVGLMHPDRGEIWVDGVNVGLASDTELYALRRRIAASRVSTSLPT